VCVVVLLLLLLLLMLLLLVTTRAHAFAGLHSLATLFVPFDGGCYELWRFFFNTTVRRARKRE
jgi:hypothetical protein